MLDSDLARLFGYETKQLNRQVQRNINRFPEKYCFKLTEEKYKLLRCQIGTSKKEETQGGRRYTPYVFTEYGVTMLAGLLKSDIAIAMSLRIVDAFIAMKRYINTNLIEQKYINNLVLEHDNDIKLLKESFDKLNSKEEVNHIFYDGEIYDAYSLLIDILSSAKEEIINTNIFHDRFILIDKKTLYHSGASFKDLGRKCFAITKIEDINIINNLLDRLEELDG